MEMMSATEFKAKFFDLLEQVGTHRIGPIGITKRGKVVAVLMSPASPKKASQGLHGFLRGSVIVPAGVDLTAPVLDEPLDAEQGRLHA